MILLLALTAPSLAATLDVADDGSGTYDSIQDAVDAAESGDTITVAAGTYRECFDTDGKDLTIEGAGAEDTTVNAGGDCAAALFVTDGEEVSVSGMSFRNGSERAVTVEDSTLSLDLVRIHDSGSSYYLRYGGGLYISGGDVTVSESVIDDNSAYYGGNIYLTGGASLALVDTAVEGGTSYYGGGIWIEAADDEEDASTVTVAGGSISDNAGSYGVGGVYVGDLGSLETDGVTIDGNSGSYGGALRLASGASWTGTDDELTGNSAGAYGYGGAVYLGGGTATLTGLTFEDNDAYYGGALYATDASTVVSSELTVTANEATYVGGFYIYDGSSMSDEGSTFEANDVTYGTGAVGIWEGATATLSGTVVTGNSSGGSGGGISVGGDSALAADAVELTDNYAESYGGGLYVYDTTEETTLDGVTVTGNESGNHGGGIYSAYAAGGLTITDLTLSENYAGGGGGGLYHYYRGSVSISGGTVADNETAASGGGLFIYPYSSAWDIRLDDLDVTGNQAPDGNGAGLYLGHAGSATLSDLRVRDNDAATDGAGGAAYLYYTGATDISHSWFCHNTAGTGGAVFSYYLTSGSSWTNNAFIENDATEYGGALYVYNDPAMVVTNNDLLGNTASRGGALYGGYAYAELVNNLFAWSEGGGVYAADTYSDYYTTATYDGWHDNDGGDVAGYYTFLTSSSDGHVTDDPVLRDYTLDGDCTNDDLLPEPDSPLIDAGDPDILDPDGGRSDIGLYGGPESLEADFDGDGYFTSHDCDDDDASVNPGAEEVCDEVDNDCDGEVDEDVSGTFYADSDEDGYGDAASSTEACEAPDGYVADATDCDDSTATTNPGAEEIPYDGADNDCVDGDLTDVDGDGFDSTAVDGGDDCDDDNDAVYPGATDSWYDGVDSDCAGNDDYDADGDGYPSDAYDGTDCADDDAGVNPGAEDLPDDGIDQDCDGEDATTGGDDGGGGDTGSGGDGGSGGDDGGDDSGSTGDDGGSDDGGSDDGVDEDPELKGEGCACSASAATSPGLAAAFLALLGLVGFRRRD